MYVRVGGGGEVAMTEMEYGTFFYWRVLWMIIITSTTTIIMMKWYMK